MQTRVIDDLGPFSAAWDRLVDAMPLPSPFLRSWWLAHVAVGEPRFVLVFDGPTEAAQLVGGLALQRSVRHGVEWLELLGTGPLEPDHLDVVAAPGRAGDVIATVRAWLSAGDRVMDFAGVRSSSWLVDAVPGWGEITALEVAPYVTLPSTADEYLASRGGRTRSTITRSTKRLDKAGVEFRVVDQSSEASTVDAALDALRELHDGRWGTASGFLAAWGPFSAAMRAGVGSGEVRFHELVDASGRIIAIEVDFVVGGRMSFYQAGRLTDHDLRGSGSVLRQRVIGAAIESGCTEFDLLRGGEDYKSEWADRRRGLVRVRRGVGLRGRAIAAMALANGAVQSWRTKRAEHATAASSGAAGAGDAPETTRIVYYTDAAQIGGAETVAKTLLGGLGDRFEVMIVGTNQAVIDDIVTVRPQSPTVLLPPIEDRSDVAAMLAHRRTLQALRPDIFHANLSEGSSCQYALLMALSIKGQRVVVTENSPMGVRSELSRRIKVWSAKRFDAHVGVGRRAAELVEADVSLPAGTMRVIPNAVPVVDHPPRSTPSGDGSIVAVSRFDWVKGLDVLIRAAALLDSANHPRITVFGDGPGRTELEKLIAELSVCDRVDLVGWVDDVRARLVDFDVFVLPSRLEGLPMSVLEAMHAGVAVVATDVGSVSEVIEDGVSGRVVPPDDPAALGAALDELLADTPRREKLAEEGRRVALDRFTSAANVAAYEALYDEVMGRPASSRLRARARH